jgi:integrase
MAMALEAEEAASYSWEDTQKIVQEVRKLDLDDARKERYAILFLLASASGLRFGELLALRMDDLDFEENTIRVNESLDRLGNVGPCKNVKAVRPVRLWDGEPRI